MRSGLLIRNDGGGTMRWLMTAIAVGLVLFGGQFARGPSADAPPTGQANLVPATPEADASASKTADTERGDQIGDGGCLAWPHPHGKAFCASGCVLSNHPTATLEKAEFERLLASYAGAPVPETSAALEALLYYGSQTRRLLQGSGAGPLDSERTDFLKRELARDHALVSFRLVDENQRVRARFSMARVPLDIRHVYDVQSADLPPLVASGTVKRVGLHHLWTRI